MKMMIFIGFVVVSTVGWWLGSLIDEGLVWPYILSSVGSVVGVYAGWRVAVEIGLD